MLEEFKTKTQKQVEHLKQELAQIRTGRATPALVENLMVECYGAKSPLVQLATITTPDPRSILIQPWDPGILKDIEKAIQSSDLGLPPQVSGREIRLSLPPLTEEKRNELVRLSKKKAEETRISIRGIREEVLKDLRYKEKEKTISEDEFFHRQKELQKATDEVSEQIKEIEKRKEKELMTI